MSDIEKRYAFDKQRICYIRAKEKKDYCFDGIKRMGYDIVVPYKGDNLLMRLLREMWFRLDFPFKAIWFNKVIKEKGADIFIIKDPLIIPEFLRWIKKIHPKARIIFEYDNRVSWSLNPNIIVETDIEKWTYDADDAEKYNMELKHGAYLDIYKVIPDADKTIDVLYLGRDKGRLNELLELEAQFIAMGLKTKFHICADRRFMRYKNKRYQKNIPYEQYLELLKQSRAILNIVQNGQTSITMREYEAVFDGVKCITSNKGIYDFKLYHPSRFFVLGNDDLNKVGQFLRTPFVRVMEDELKEYTFDFMVRDMIERNRGGNNC